MMSKKYHFDHFRNLGDMLIGCCGYFESFKEKHTVCHLTVLMAIEIMQFARRYKLQLSCAIDYGTIVSGFINNINFDLHGSEVRWVSNVAISNKVYTISLNKRIKRQLRLYHSEYNVSNYEFVESFVKPLLESQPDIQVECRCICYCDMILFDKHSVIRSLISVTGHQLKLKRSVMMEQFFKACYHHFQSLTIIYLMMTKV
jgi:hypothetical protein